MKKLILLLVLLALGLGAYYGLSEYNRGLEAADKVDFSLSCQELFSAFENDENAANAKYLDKVVEISGTVQEVSTNKEGKVTVTLDGGMLFGVTCEMFDKNVNKQKFAKGNKIKLKGICTGYLSDVVLVRCSESS